MIVKHQGKKHEVDLDPASNGETFKFQLYSLTGVEPDRQKVLVKGGQLKDDTETLDAECEAWTDIHDDGHTLGRRCSSSGSQRKDEGLWKT